MALVARPGRPDQQPCGVKTMVRGPRVETPGWTV